MDKKLLLVFALSVVVFYSNIQGISIYILDEAKNATCAREMWERGDLIVPTFNGELRTDKPVLHYYFMMLGYTFFGANPFGARFFSALMGVLVVLITFGFTSKLLNRKIAFYSALVLIASLQMAVQFHLAVPDPYLIFFMTLAFFSFYYAYTRDKRYYYLFYLSSGLAFLTKGPIGVVFPGLVVLIFLWLNQDLSWKSLLRIRLLPGIAIGALVILPWYTAVTIATDGEWLRGFLFEHNVGRFTNTMEGHGGFIGAAPLIVIMGLLPFSLFIFQAFYAAWLQRKEERLLLYALVVVGVIVIFFSFSRTILPTYLEPCLPLGAVVLGWFMQELEERSRQKQYRIKLSAWVFFIIMLLIPPGLYIGLQMDPTIPHLNHLAFYFVVLPIGAAMGLYFVWRQQIVPAYYSWAGSFILTGLLFFSVIFPRIDRENPVYGSRYILEEKGAKVLYYKIMNPSYVFYYDRPIPKLNTLEEVKQHITGEQQVYIISRAQYEEELTSVQGLKLIHSKHDLFELPTTIVMAKD